MITWLLWSLLYAGSMAVAWANLASGATPSWCPRVWRSDDGLPENNVTGTLQTPDGYLWVSTHAGLARFDGVQFKRASLPNDAGFHREMIRASLLDHRSTVWLALEGGFLISFSPKGTNVFTSAHGLPHGWPLVLTEGGDGAIWIGYADGIAIRIANNQVQRFDENDGLVGQGGCWLTADSGGQVWFAKGGSVGLFRGGRFVSLLSVTATDVRLSAARAGRIWIGGGSQLLSYAEGHQPTVAADLGRLRGAAAVSALLEDRGGTVWIGTRAHGLFRYQATSLQPVETSHPEILSVAEDREGNCWIGTGGGGLNRLRPCVLELQETKSGLPFEVVRSVCEDSTGKLWAAMQNGALVCHQRETWEVVSTNAGWTGAPATCVAAGKRGDVWIGTDRGGLVHYQDGVFTVLNRRDGLAGDLVRSLLTDNDGSLWIGLELTNCLQRLQGGRFQTFALPRVTQPVRTMVQDAQGALWMGTGDGGLLRVQGDSLVNEAPRTLPVASAVRCLYATPDGSLWIGYAGAGIGRLKEGRFTQIGVAQGLLDEFISTILADSHGWVWLASNRGVFKIRQTELDRVAEDPKAQVHSIMYGRDEGLPNLQASYGFGPTAMRSRDGRIWIPMLTGLAVVHPEITPPDRTPPPTVIEAMMIDGQPLGLPTSRTSPGLNARQVHSVATPRLPPDHRRLEFQFTALSFIAPEGIRFRHRLDGLDEAWVETHGQRTVSYSRLPAGNYRFRVKACSNAGVWDDSDVGLRFAVDRFYWQAWWFRLGVGGSMLAAFGWGILRFQRRKLQRKLEILESQHAVERERGRIARDLHDEMGANLTQIALLSELAQSDLSKPEQAKGHIDEVFRTAQSLTRSLDEIVWAVNPINDTLENFAAHLCTFGPSFLRSAGVRCRLDVPTDLPAVPLPAGVRHHLHLSAKEALHNIVKHAQATEVWLRLRVTSDKLTLILEDNGRGFSPTTITAESADGLGNLRQRMKEINGSIEQRSQAGCGTVTTLLAPLDPSME